MFVMIYTTRPQNFEPLIDSGLSCENIEKNQTPEFKVRVELDAIWHELTLAEFLQKYGLHFGLISA